MEYFKYGHGKWYSKNLSGYIKFEVGYFQKTLFRMGQVWYKEQEHEARKTNRK